MSAHLFSDERGGAVLSDCGTYRYSLWRKLDDSSTCRTMLFVMLNPSTADASNDDPTIRRCIGFARREGCNRLEVVNLYAFRATKPKDLIAAHACGVDVVGPDNVAHVHDSMHGAAFIVAGWGAHGNMPDTPIRDLIEARARRVIPEVWKLGATKDGSPRHPLYVRSDEPLSPLGPRPLSGQGVSPPALRQREHPQSPPGSAPHPDQSRGEA